MKIFKTDTVRTNRELSHFIKGQDDMDLLDSIFKNAFGKNTENSKVHVVYAGLSYFLLRFNDPLDLFFRFFLHALQRYGLESI